MGADCILDDRVTLEHVRIYWSMSKAVPRGTNRCKIGQRRISEVVNVSQSTVCRRIQDLIEWGKVIHHGGRGERAVYELTDPAFLLKAKARRDTFAAKKIGRPETRRAQMAAGSRQSLDEIFPTNAASA
jgi:hypothetical protein